MSEAELERELGAEWGIRYGKHIHISSIESPITSPGFPDLDICINGIRALIELKFSCNNKPPEIRPTQVRWHKRRSMSGGRSWILVKFRWQDNWNYAIISGDKIHDLAHESTLRSWVSYSKTLVTCCVNEKLSNEGWAMLLESMVGVIRTSVCKSDQSVIQ